MAPRQAGFRRGRAQTAALDAKAASLFLPRLCSSRRQLMMTGNGLANKGKAHKAQTRNTTFGAGATRAGFAC
jgi:hypothetical protein